MQNFFTALRYPLFIVVVVAAVLGGLFVNSWLLPLGLVVYLAAAGLAARDPALALAAQQSAQRSAQQQAMARLTSERFRALVSEVDSSAAQISRSAAQAEGPLATLLQRITAQTGELVEQAHALGRKGQIIEEYLRQINYQQIQAQINDVDARIATTSDSYTQQQLQDTRRALVERQDNARALETYIGRIIAQIQNIDANLDNVLAETVRLRTADMVSADSASNQVAERLRDLNSDMDSFQRVLDTALYQSGAAPVG